MSHLFVVACTQKHRALDLFIQACVFLSFSPPHFLTEHIRHNYFVYNCLNWMYSNCFVLRVCMCIHFHNFQLDPSPNWDVHFLNNNYDQILSITFTKLNANKQFIVWIDVSQYRFFETDQKLFFSFLFFRFILLKVRLHEAINCVQEVDMQEVASSKQRLACCICKFFDLHESWAVFNFLHNIAHENVVCEHSLWCSDPVADRLAMFYVLFCCVIKSYYYIKNEFYC